MKRFILSLLILAQVPAMAWEKNNPEKSTPRSKAEPRIEKRGGEEASFPVFYFWRRNPGADARGLFVVTGPEEKAQKAGDEDYLRVRRRRGDRLREEPGLVSPSGKWKLLAQGKDSPSGKAWECRNTITDDMRVVSLPGEEGLVFHSWFWGWNPAHDLCYFEGAVQGQKNRSYYQFNPESGLCAWLGDGVGIQVSPGGGWVVWIEGSGSIMREYSNRLHAYDVAKGRDYVVDDGPAGFIFAQWAEAGPSKAGK